ncbi:CRISPR-associated protein, Csh2 family [Cyclobacterium xiamenense]|uniref:CRISPR-associated protein, Csh2 family n=1 Tax=Cyclobacterium xiamenense TaxID=1297121 RepID=A0A1H7ALQ5_9BACT|nr:type I-B CRISPR-associated protein Cas7/Csh2 [Cyclobacterium xiamenense]SEJ66308.1 CRISPR-associated protein, Csh2 family [Cyclobacterium xiamenense]
MNNVQNRSELIFLYDLKYANPNGDPMDSNRPRIDEDSNHCLVTDVRLKRTIRDYFMNHGYDGSEGSTGDIFIRDENGKPVTGKKRGDAYKDANEFKSKFIDVRLFGGVSAVEKKKFNFTGPVQFGMGKSLHPVKENFIKGTGAFATKEGAEQRTFREEYNITYGLIGFHGIINENAAKHTDLKENDIDVLLEGIWKGTKDLISRSKKGHMPRLLIKIDYQPGFYIGDLLESLSLDIKGEKEPIQIEDVSDYIVNTNSLNSLLKNYENKIISISVEKDERLELSEPIINANLLNLT